MKHDDTVETVENDVSDEGILPASEGITENTFENSLSSQNKDIALFPVSNLQFPSLV